MVENITITRPFRGIKLKNGRYVERSNPAFFSIKPEEHDYFYDNFGTDENIEILKTYNIDQLEQLIKNSVMLKESIDLVRSTTDKNARGFYKATRLPSVFFGKFNLIKDEKGKFKITDDGLVQHSNIICLDIDKIPVNYMWYVKNLIKNDLHTLMLFESPSGNGYKLLMLCDEINGRHRDYYRAAVSYWKNVLPIDLKNSVDTACINPSRRCYLSHDPDVYVNKNCTIWTQVEEEPIPVEKIKKIEYEQKPIEEIFEMCVKRVEEGIRGSKDKGTLRIVTPLAFVDGQKHNFVLSLCGMCSFFMNKHEFENVASNYLDKKSQLIVDKIFKNK